MAGGSGEDQTGWADGHGKPSNRGNDRGGEMRESNQREIKFRQWNPNWKRMQYNIGASEGTWTGPQFVTWDKYPIMQFTGLHDKNGNEIWEGDIVRSDEFIGDIRFIKGSFCVWHKNLPEDWCKEYVPCYGGMNDYEVIGNIYENPSLLDAQ